MRVFAFPRHGIAYTASFYEALEALGVEVQEGIFSARWLWPRLRRGDVAHLHWPSFYYATDVGRGRLLLNFLRYCVVLAAIRLRGGRIAWTAHNLLPHDPSLLPAVDRAARRVLIALSARVFAHGESAAAILRETFPGVDGKLTLISHGHWIGRYPGDIDRAAARAKLGLEVDDYVCLFFGMCKPYKSLHTLMGAFRRMPDPKLRLLVAGTFPDPAYRARVVELAGGDPRIRFDSRIIPDEEVAPYMLACDAVVAPYREILTSGTAMLAMGFGRPVLSLARGALCDIVTPRVGVLCRVMDEESLQAALEAICATSFDEEEIVAHARRYTFDDAARRFVAALG
jgi:glycosyltransferase involved in cell wall biosynthesis